MSDGDALRAPRLRRVADLSEKHAYCIKIASGHFAFETLKPETQQVATAGVERPMRIACPRKINLVWWQRRRCFFMDRRRRMSRLSALS